MLSFRRTIPTPYSRCRRQNLKYLVDIRSGRCKNCNDSHTKYNLRVTFKEFEKLAKLHTKLARQSEALEDKLSRTEEEATRTYTYTIGIRNRVRIARKRLVAAEISEDKAYARKAAGILEVAEMECTLGETSVRPELPSTFDLSSLGEDASEFSILPKEWLAADNIPAE